MVCAYSCLWVQSVSMLGGYNYFNEKVECLLKLKLVRFKGTTEGSKVRGERNRRKGQSLLDFFFLAAVAAVAVIFPSGGTESPWPVHVRERPGDGSARYAWRAWPCWRGAPLVEVTGARSCSPGACDTALHLPPEPQRQHFFYRKWGIKSREEN